MKNIFLPREINFQPDKENKNKGFIIIEPCYPGYGITWGNALRRVLLTSLSGAAVVSVKIKGIKHEFSSIPYVYQDALGIILNLKSLRLKIFSENDDPIKLRLKAVGKKKVYASDIEKSANVEITNPDLLIADLTDKKAELEMEIWVAKGYGWVPSEAKTREDLDIGTIVVDSIFTPILQVSINIENVRVGGRTDYDRLILGVETDGTISPLEAGLKAMQLLNEQFSYLSELTATIISSQQISKKKKKSSTIKPKVVKKASKKVVKKIAKKVVKKTAQKAVKKKSATKSKVSKRATKKALKSEKKKKK
ncbi:DNA-directed RNA polymerase subunit alpha [Candidatus Parcubacteria bacterium 4484_255]|nr:MAG: DNA-directed RNA polymerase subunit alpha [Candidatus Parcubacteria bacterium 4484_255]